MATATMMRRLLVLAAAGAAVGAPTVDLDGCAVEGVRAGAVGATFMSIPFAEPPRRWEEAVGVTNYAAQAAAVCSKGRLDATAPRARCYQLLFDPVRTPTPPPPMSEDCLHVDIYTPELPGPASAAERSSLRKVMVYFHGGSSVSGASLQYNFTRFAREHDTVVVVPSYRLALVGFAAFSALSAVSPTGTSGNYGLMDCRAALQWIQRYIAGFGGDPADVTVFGQSTGGTIILSLLGTPSARGLVTRGIVLSGSPNVSMSAMDAAVQGDAAVAQFGCGGLPSAAATVACMRAVPAQALMDHYPQQWMDADNNNFGIPGPDPAGFREAGLMIVDGYLVTQSTFDAVRSGIHHFPILIGNTQYEPDFKPNVRVNNITTDDAFAAFMHTRFAAWGPTFGVDLWKQHYAWEYAAGGAPLVTYGVGTDATGFCGGLWLAQHAADSPAFASPVYVFSHQQWPAHPFRNGPDWECHYSFHTIDLFAAAWTWDSFAYWGALPYTPGASDEEFGAAIRRHWRSFMHDNAPETSWPEYTAANGYPVALIGNGTHKAEHAGRTLAAQRYKQDVCRVYAAHGIGAHFWWSN